MWRIEPTHALARAVRGGTRSVVWVPQAQSAERMVRSSAWAASKSAAGVVPHAAARSQSRSELMLEVPRSSRESVGLLTPLMSASSP